MRSQADGYGYNERLFSGGLRTRLHLARFRWIRARLAALDHPQRAVLELGCFDGKLLDFLPQPPERYVGFDANWEGGLDAAIAERANARVRFQRASSPEEMRLAASERFDVAVAMETLEHVPPHLVDGYLERIAAHLDGYLFVTVPNESGLPFLAKWMAKRLLSRDAERYNAAEVVNATLGRMSRVARVEHKGFDWRELVRTIERRFDIVEVSGHPLGGLPPALCFAVGIVARAKH